MNGAGVATHPPRGFGYPLTLLAPAAAEEGTER